MRKVRLGIETVLLYQHHSLDSVRAEEVRRRKIRGERDRTIVKFVWFHLPTVTTPVGVEQERGWRIEWQIQLNKLLRTLPQGADDSRGRHRPAPLRRLASRAQVRFSHLAGATNSPQLPPPRLEFAIAQTRDRRTRPAWPTATKAILPAPTLKRFLPYSSSSRSNATSAAAKSITGFSDNRA